LIDGAISEGDMRWGIQVRRGLIDIGLGKSVAYHEEVSDQEPTLFRIVSGPPRLKLERVDRSGLSIYFGYAVETENDLIDRLRKSSGTRIVLSRSGTPYQETERRIAESVSVTLGLTAVFGAPTEGVSEIFADRRDDLESVVDIWLNTAADQGTETIRLEEALLISLALLNDSFGRLVTQLGFYGKEQH
jgi:predicted SPOUT superfamily RNA methylase MTH1